MKKIILFAFMAIYATMAVAQVNPKSGYIITLENDTIWGELDLRNDEYNMEKCNFRQEGRQRWVTYKPEDIEGYRFSESGKMYVSKLLNIKGERTLCFAEYMVKGLMNLYYVPVGERYYFENENGKIVEYTYDFDDTLPAGNSPANDAEDKRKENIRPLVGLLKNSKAALEKVSIYKMYREDLIKVAQAYHEDVCTSNEDCIVYSYDKSANKTKIHYRIFAGGAYAPIYKLDDSNNSSYIVPAIGLGVDIELNRIMKGLTAQVQATYCMKAKMDGMLKVSNNREFEYTAETSHLFIDAGALYQLKTDGGIHPMVRAGLTADKSTEDLKNITKNESRDMLIFGGYAGAGVEVPVGKFALTLDITGKMLFGNKSKCILMATAGIKL